MHTGDRPGLVARMRLDTRPFRIRNFRNLWFGQSISELGGEIGAVAVPYQVYQLTNSTAMVGLLGLASLIPLLCVPLLGGAIADAVDRRSVLLRSETGMAVVAGLFLANSLLPHPRVWVLFALQALAMSIFSLGRPAMASLNPRLVPDDQIAAAASLQSVYGSFVGVAGPALGGALIAVTSVSWTYAIDAATYAASLIALYLLPALPPDERADRVSLRAIREGFRYLSRRQVLIGIFAVDTSAMVFGMPSALFPAFAKHQLHGGAFTYSLLVSAVSAGALIATLVSGWTTYVRRQGLAVTIAACVWGAAILLFGFTTTLWPALTLLAIAGGADFFSAILRETILNRATAPHMLGRMSGIEWMQVAGAPNLGDLEAGIVASLTSLRVAVVSGGVLSIVGCVAVALSLPKFLRYDSTHPRDD
jgi:MFS family permease